MLLPLALLPVKAFFVGAWKLFLAIPIWIKLLLLFALSIWGTSAYTEYQTRKIITAKHEKKIAALHKYYFDQSTIVRDGHERAAATQKRESDRVNGELKTKLLASEARKREKQIIIERIPHYVSQKSDAACTIPVGFVYAYDSTLAGEDAIFPRSEPVDADAPSSIALSGVAKVAASNNAECVARGEVIKAWQEWYPKQKEIYEHAQGIIAAAVAKSKEVKQE